MLCSGARVVEVVGVLREVLCNGFRCVDGRSA